MEWVWKIVLWDVGMVSCFEDDGNGRVYLEEQAFLQGVMVEWKLRDGERGGYMTIPVSQYQAVFTLPGQDYGQRLI